VRRLSCAPAAGLGLGSVEPSGGADQQRDAVATEKPVAQELTWRNGWHAGLGDDPLADLVEVLSPDQAQKLAEHVQALYDRVAQGDLTSPNHLARLNRLRERLGPAPRGFDNTVRMVRTLRRDRDRIGDSLLATTDRAEQHRLDATALSEEAERERVAGRTDAANELAAQAGVANERAEKADGLVKQHNHAIGEKGRALAGLRKRLSDNYVAEHQPWIARRMALDREIAATEARARSINQGRDAAGLAPPATDRTSRETSNEAGREADGTFLSERRRRVLGEARSAVLEAHAERSKEQLSQKSDQEIMDICQNPDRVWRHAHAKSFFAIQRAERDRPIAERELAQAKSQGQVAAAKAKLVELDNLVHDVHEAGLDPDAFLELHGEQAGTLLAAQSIARERDLPVEIEESRAVANDDRALRRAYEQAVATNVRAAEMSMA
jgi:hypothetical protein